MLSSESSGPSVSAGSDASAEVAAVSEKHFMRNNEPDSDLPDDANDVDF